MRILTLAALGAFALAFSTIGCSADTQDDGAAAVSDVTVKREVVATESDDGKTIQVTEGDLFTLKLKANATTGYKWKVTKTDRTFAYPTSDEYQAPSGAGPVGSGGTQVLTWSTDAVSDAHGTPVISKVGKHQLQVEYRRPWEPAETCAGSACSPTPAAKTFKITVEVLAAPNNSTDNGGYTPGELDNDHCGDDVCGDRQECQWCWGQPACIPRGAMC